MGTNQIIDLSKLDLLTARDKLYELVRAAAESLGMKPDIECALRGPYDELGAERGGLWRVVWEAGPFEWGTKLSLGRVVGFGDEDGRVTSDFPGVVMGRAADWHLEPYWSFDVGFVSDQVFAEFALVTPHDALVEVTGFVERELMREIAVHPEILRTIERRQFERLVAELFDGFGFTVELTKRTRDGGKDVIAVRREFGIESRFLIECKRPDAGNKVAVATVRELLGVWNDDPANRAILVTTTDFTSDARALIDRHRWVLDGKAYAEVVEWVRDYNKIKGR